MYLSRVEFENPEDLGWNTTALPLYSGKVLLASSQGERLSVPYLGEPLLSKIRNYPPR